MRRPPRAPSLRWRACCLEEVFWVAALLESEVGLLRASEGGCLSGGLGCWATSVIEGLGSNRLDERYAHSVDEIVLAHPSYELSMKASRRYIFYLAATSCERIVEWQLNDVEENVCGAVDCGSRSLT